MHWMHPSWPLEPELSYGSSPRPSSLFGVIRPLASLPFFFSNRTPAEDCLDRIPLWGSIGSWEGLRMYGLKPSPPDQIEVVEF